MNITAKLTKKLPVEQIPLKDGGTLSKQIGVFEWTETNKGGDQFNKMLAIEFVQKAVQRLATVNEGDTCEVGFDVSSREWTKDGKTSYFTSARGFAVSSSSTAQPSQGEELPSQLEGQDDSLPF